jgi:glycerol-3-phosphate dehydrogenase
MFSVNDRPDGLARATATGFDLLVIGGGVTGCGIALDASLRGLSVVLLEKQDLAAGTSSRSTKLIHGGLRYLKQMEVNLVREVGRERETVYHNAPHLVIPERMLLPIVKGGSLSRWGASLGLYVYDMLAGVKRSERRGMLTKERTLLREPLLRKEALVAGAIYWEYRTDDARLVISIARRAVETGAVILPYAKVESLDYADGRVSGATATDLLRGTRFNVRAKRVVNAAGPWVDELRKADNSLKGKRLHLTKGVHIVVPHERLPLRQALYFDVKDGRMVFAIPREGATYIGTTDTEYKGPLERPRVEAADISYLLSAANAMFEIQPLSAADVIGHWAGLRPLIHQDGRLPSELSRKDEIFISDSGLISMAGGKMTGYRKMSERAVDLVMRHLELEGRGPFISSTTAREHLAGGDFTDPEAFGSMARALADTYAEVFRREAVLRIAHRYGTHAPEVMAAAARYQAESVSPATLLAEADFGVRNEHVTCLCDLLIRRTGMLYFDRAAALRHAEAVNNHLGSLLKWDHAQRERSLKEFLSEAEG